MPPEVSIMLPARNAAATLEAAARSCLDQSFEDFELLLIADGADGATWSIMRSLARSDPRVRLVNGGEPPGFIRALNAGWRAARGRLLARMDSDDLCHPDRIARQVELMHSRPDLAACATLVKILRRDGRGETLPPLPGYAEFERWLNSVQEPGEIAAARFIDSPVANPTAMVRREVFDELGGYRDVAWAEDYDFWLRLLERGMSVAKVPDVLLHWFDSESRLTRNDGHYSQGRFLEAKAHFLARVPPVSERGVSICGAGPIGKRFARLLKSEGRAVHGFYEVNERRIGRSIAGVPVLASDAVPAPGPGGPVLVGAVGLRGGRARVRSLVRPLGYTEGEDFFCVA